MLTSFKNVVVIEQKKLNKEWFSVSTYFSISEILRHNNNWTEPKSETRIYSDQDNKYNLKTEDFYRNHWRLR